MYNISKIRILINSLFKDKMRMDMFGESHVYRLTIIASTVWSVWTSVVYVTIIYIYILYNCTYAYNILLIVITFLF